MEFDAPSIDGGTVLMAELHIGDRNRMSDKLLLCRSKTQRHHCVHAQSGLETVTHLFEICVFAAQMIAAVYVITNRLDYFGTIAPNVLFRIGLFSFEKCLHLAGTRVQLFSEMWSHTKKDIWHALS